MKNNRYFLTDEMDYLNKDNEIVVTRKQVLEMYKCIQAEKNEEITNFIFYIDKRKSKIFL